MLYYYKDESLFEFVKVIVLNEYSQLVGRFHYKERMF